MQKAGGWVIHRTTGQMAKGKIRYDKEYFDQNTKMLSQKKLISQL